ncbi:MAG: hydrogenase maturation nickel metallochaperone HypA [Leptospiraceae bacterium]|nr:hydrogenase maturation nickel metallochaperone HypA [Leptospiraceae bacterium]MCP5500301.1 hydrogenase maturation nickel metallochaperone HypA [Leptospiraceae bacterium]
MHEMGIAEEILEIVNQQAKEGNIVADITTVYFKASFLNSIYPDSLKFYYDAIKERYPSLNKSNLEIEILPLRHTCPKCREVKELFELFYECEKCQMPSEIEIDTTMTVDSFTYN